MNSILKNKNFEGLNHIFVVCFNEVQENSVLKAIESCNEGFKWENGQLPTKFSSKGVFVHDYFSYNKGIKINRYIICIDLKYKKLTYITDNESLDSLGIHSKIIKERFGVYMQIDFVINTKLNSILDDKEKEYLSAVIRPFKGRVKCIRKRQYGLTREFIVIVVNFYNDSTREENIDLPLFKRGSMYKDMEVNKDYTLEELELN